MASSETSHRYSSRFYAPPSPSPLSSMFHVSCPPYPPPVLSCAPSVGFYPQRRVLRFQLGLVCQRKHSYLSPLPSQCSQIGPYLTVTFILQALGPIAANIYKFYISGPCQRCYAFPKIANMSSHKYVRQADVNALVPHPPAPLLWEPADSSLLLSLSLALSVFLSCLFGFPWLCVEKELGQTFDVTANTAQLQALLFFAMTYSPGTPPSPYLPLPALTPLLLSSLPWLC
jgi:hypothetical protein